MKGKKYTKSGNVWVKTRLIKKRFGDKKGYIKTPVNVPSTHKNYKVVRYQNGKALLKKT